VVVSRGLERLSGTLRMMEVARRLRRPRSRALVLVRSLALGSFAPVVVIVGFEAQETAVAMAPVRIEMAMANA
jgi:hypothetical protein